MGLNREDIVRSDAASLRRAMESGPRAERWSRFSQLAGADAEQVLKLVCGITPSGRIHDLRTLETQQAERGAGFLGMLPDQIPDDLDVPDDMESSLDVAARLAEIRRANLDAIRETMPQYPLAFSGESNDRPSTASIPTGWMLDVDVSGIRALLDAFESSGLVPDEALRIARMSSFQEMMTHRRELGYVPEPLIDEAGLAWCIAHAASRDPVDELWKWLHPHNLFDLSDLYTHRTEYRQLTDVLAGEHGLSSWVLPRISRYAPPGTMFQDRFSFAVGWGIRGWATETSGGMNIEHAKDDWDLLTTTLVHETYHRLQTKIAFADPAIDEIGFERITSLPASVSGNRHLYRALSYIMLEGSATYVAAPILLPAWHDDAAAGMGLLERLCEIDESERADESADGILNEGLRSNGPFYGFGALLSDAIVRHGTESDLGIALTRGGPAFVERGLDLVETSLAPDSAKVRSAIAELRGAVERAAQ